MALHETNCVIYKIEIGCVLLWSLGFTSGQVTECGDFSRMTGLPPLTFSFQMLNVGSIFLGSLKGRIEISMPIGTISLHI